MTSTRLIYCGSRSMAVRPCPLWRVGEEMKKNKVIQILVEDLSWHNKFGVDCERIAFIRKDERCEYYDGNAYKYVTQSSIRRVLRLIEMSYKLLSPVEYKS